MVRRQHPPIFKQHDLTLAGARLSTVEEDLDIAG